MIPADTPLWMWCATITGVLCWGLTPVIVAMLVIADRRDRRHARAALRLERRLLDRLTAPDGQVPPDTLAAGRDRLHAAVDADHLRDLVGPIDWPKDGDQ